MMQQVGPLEKAKIFLSENAVRQNSWTRTLCFLTFDLLLLAGFVWHVWITQRDWEYWQDAPNMFNIFLVIQYTLLALCIRFPVTTAFKQSTITKVSLLLGLVLLINTIVGTVWFLALTDSNQSSTTDTAASAQVIGGGIYTPREDSIKPAFDLKDNYIAHGVIMILIPWSIFFFLIIVLVKVICFFWAEHKKRDQQLVRNSEIRSRYGKFNDDEQVDHETEAVIGVYFKIMERVRYRSVNESGDPAENVSNGIDYSYMADQRQCRLCL